MIIYPAIDIIDGKCVRLTQGKFDQVDVYGDDLVEIALKWKQAGAKWLHMVDLDGARGRKNSNPEKIKEVALVTGLLIEVGGGIRDMNSLENVLKNGVSRAIIGTAAVKNPDFLKEAIKEFGDKVAVGIDAKDGLVAIDGWESKSSLQAVEFARHIEAMGVKTIIYTDISRDGMMMGPNLKAMQTMKNAVAMEVIASGGVSSIEDLQQLRSIGMPGAIVGKALYNGAINLKDAFESLK
jgi:phosphoribosylformimino-5-aminoimidazole carboxamide ribotide isomerase